MIVGFILVQVMCQNFDLSLCSIMLNSPDDPHYFRKFPGNFLEISRKLPETPQKFPYTPGVPHTHIIPPHPLPTHPILPPSISPIPQLQSRFSPFFIFPLSAHLFPDPLSCIGMHIDHVSLK